MAGNSDDGEKSHAGRSCRTNSSTEKPMVTPKVFHRNSVGYTDVSAHRSLGCMDSDGTVVVTSKGITLKKFLLFATAALLLVSGYAVAEKLHDWHDLDAVHNHVQDAIHEMEHARAANHYDMDGHGAKAEALLHDAERELNAAVESAKRAR
jgi:hypothetical protein